MKDFMDAMIFVDTVKLMESELPDGMYDEVIAVWNDYVDTYGDRVGRWDRDTKQSFKEEIYDLKNYWM